MIVFFVALTFEFMSPRPSGVFEVDGLLLDSILVPNGAVRLNNQALVDLAIKTNTYSSSLPHKKINYYDLFQKPLATLYASQRLIFLFMRASIKVLVEIF